MTVIDWFTRKYTTKRQQCKKNTPAVIGEGAATLEMKWTAKSNKTKSGQF